MNFVGIVFFMTVINTTDHSAQKSFTSSIENKVVGKHWSVELAVSKSACLYNQTFLRLLLGWGTRLAVREI